MPHIPLRPFGAAGGAALGKTCGRLHARPGAGRAPALRSPGPHSSVSHETPSPADACPIAELPHSHSEPAPLDEPVSVVSPAVKGLRMVSFSRHLGLVKSAAVVCSIHSWTG